jgi:hypothetical protein
MIPFAVISTAIILSTAFVPLTLAISYSTGLRPGDTVMYTLSGSNKLGTDSVQMRVLDVAGTRVTVNLTDYPPSALPSGNMWIDVFDGSSSSPTSNLFFAVSSGLRLADPIFNNGNISVLTQQANVCGGQSRSLIYTQYQRQGQFVQAAWDQNSGVMCNYSARDQGASSGTLGFTLVNATMWALSSPTDVSAIAAEVSAALGLPLVVLILFVYFRKRKTRKYIR